MKKNKKITQANYIAIGFGLEHLTAVEQAEICHCLVDQFDRFAQSLSDGYLGTVNMINGLLQISVSSEDPEKTVMDVMAKLENGEIDVPKDNDETSVIEYVMIGGGDPLKAMFNRPNQVNVASCCKNLKKGKIEMTEMIQAIKRTVEKRSH
jgi:hypothetical protein